MRAKKLRAILLAAVCWQSASCTAVGELPEPAFSTVAEAPRDEVREVEPWAKPGIERRTIKAAGLDRKYVLSLPAGARQRDRLPVIFAFHGYREDPETTRRASRLDRADALVAYMSGVGNAWAPAPYAKTSGEQDLAFVDEVLDELSREFSVDRARVFATGMSNGGGFAAYLGCQRPQDFTGVATVSAAFYEHVSEGCSQIPMKLIDFHGTDDSIISYQGGERHESVYESTQEMLEETARRNHCAGREEDIEVTAEITRIAWDDCDAATVHYRIEGGPHTWPGGVGDKSGTAPAGFATRAQLKFFGVGYN